MILKLGESFSHLNFLNCSCYDELEKLAKNLDYSKEGYMLYSMNREFRTKLKGESHKNVLKIKKKYP